MPMLVSSQKKKTLRAKGTTVGDPCKDEKDQMLAQFKSKVLQQMENKMRNAGDS
eukprot:CAMPEP_0170452602 /NCGR_PEP_ID=MMETSP0123-20130129/1442_1 /TAXON_ID=182087 /ORGANISM="Favella ehrenbergii, Strain Fehren 1" /LENGTH=53 /DNA_ID=CAMNT_0010714655 /DNA_START=1776 /DNA_END=1937 /DNA_ORIENTATION=+